MALACGNRKAISLNPQINLGGNSSFVLTSLNKDELPHGFILWNNK
jgi:hypothetical protein